MDFVAWLTIGIASAVVFTQIFRLKIKGGVSSALAIGVIGAIEGGFFSYFFFNPKFNTLNLISVVMSLASVLLLFLLAKLFASSSNKASQTAS